MSVALKSQSFDAFFDGVKLARSARRDYSQFMVKAGYQTPFPSQLEWYQFLAQCSDARLFLGARGYGKTEYLTLGAVAHLIYQDATFTALIIVKSDARRAGLMMAMEHLLKSNGVDIAVSSQTNGIWVGGNVGNKEANFCVLPVESSSFRGHHPKLIVFDDAVTPDDRSAAARRAVMQAYSECHNLTSNICIIGQPVHRHDLHMTLRGKIKTLVAPHGTIPELDKDLAALDAAQISQADISANYLLELLDCDLGSFSDVEVQERGNYSPPSCHAFIDPSMKGKDFTAMAMVWKDWEKLIVFGFCWRNSWDKCVPEFKRLVSDFNVSRLFFEINGLGNFPLDILRGNGVPAMPYHTTTNKDMRIESLGVFAEKIVLLSDGSFENRQFIDNFKQWDRTAKNDDAVDAVASLAFALGLIKV